MKLPSTLREKRHYIIIKRTDEFRIKNALMDYLGIINYAKAGPKVIHLQEKTAISLERDFVNIAKTALIMSKIPVIKVTGTIKKARS
jgi:RNase P/RNase MRP subunit POP5